MVAAGSGSRLGAAVPKALVSLAGTSLVRRSCDALLAGGVGHFVVTVPAGHEGDVAAAMDGFPAPTRVVVGGERRQDSVRAAVTEVLADFESAVVLVHDAARPLLPAAVVSRVVDAVREGADAVVPVVPVIDSVRELGPESSSVVNRDLLRAVQTPQGFRLATLAAAHAHVVDEGLEVTDDAAACEALGLLVTLVEGHRDAFKITEPIDLVLAGALLAGPSA